jgi:hypothetical protein
MDICEQIVYRRRSQAPLNCYNAPSHFTGKREANAFASFSSAVTNCPPISSVKAT